MKRNFLLLAFLCVFLVGFGTGSAQAQTGAISIDQIVGLEGGKLDTLQPLKFYLRFNNNTGVKVDLSNGWRVSSPDGATWDSVRIDSVGPVSFGENVWFNKYFNIVFSLAQEGADGTSPDTLGFIAAGNPTQATRQLPAGWNDTALAIIVWQSGNENNGGKTLCIDSSFWGIGGTWKWVGSNLMDYYPTWQGQVGQTHVPGQGFCFTYEGGGPPPFSIAVSPNALTFTATEGGSNPVAQNFEVTKVGGGATPFTLSESIAWLSVTPTSGNTPQSVAVNVAIAALTAGTYVDSIQVNATGATNTPQYVKVTLTVNASPKTLVVSPDTLTFVVQEDGPLPVFQNFSVTEQGGAAIPYTASETSAWFSLQNASGTTPGTVRVDITTSNVAPGTYVDSVMFTSAGATNSPLYKYVKYVVNQAPRILVVEPVLLNFSAVEGGANPAGQAVTVTESHDDTIAFTATEDAGWITLTGTDLTTPGGFTVNVDITGVTEGIYTDTVLVESGEAQNSPIRVEVVLTVSPPEAKILDLTPDTLFFTGTVGDDFAAQWFRVNEAGGSSIAFTASETSAWIVITDETGTTPDSVLVDLDLTGVTAGTYLDSIMVSSGEADNSPVWEFVKLTLNPAGCPTMAVSDTAFATSGEVDVVIEFTDTIAITSSGPGEIDWTTLNVADGITILPSSGTTPSGAVVFSFSKTYTEAGSYNECFQIRGTQPSAPACTSWANVCLSVTVTGGPACANIVVSDTLFEFTAVEGEAATPSQLPFEVTLSDGGSAAFMISRPLDEEWVYFVAGTDTLTVFNGMTPASGKIIVDPTGLTPGFYDAVLVLSSEATNVCEPKVRTMLVTLTVTGAPQPVADSVRIGTVAGAPGGDAGVPVYLSNECDLLAGALALTWNGDYLYLDSVSYAGSRINTGATRTSFIHNGPDTALLSFEADNISEVIPAGAGLWGTLWFSVDASTPLGTSTDVTLYGEGATLTRNCGDSIEVVTPAFVEGGVVVDSISEEICGYVTDEEGIEIEGATVQLWANFPYGEPVATTTTDENGAFFFDGPAPMPYDIYAFATGYYPGLHEDMTTNQCGTIVLKAVDELIPSPNWVDYYCGTNTLMDSIPLPVGTVIEVRDPQGMLVGQQYVTEPGLYPFMPVYRDSMETPEDEGAQTGDMLLFYINGTPAQTEPEVVIYPADYQQVQVCLNGNMAPQVCTLMPGWNLVSWRVDTPTDDIETVLGPIMDCIEVVLGFEGGGLTYDPELQEFSTLWYVDHLSGYWVKVKDGCSPELVLNGVVVPANTPIPVYAGWNLVSYLPDVPMAPTMALTSIMDKLIIAYGYDMGVKVFKPDQPNFNTLEMMEMCHGYWLKVTAPDQLIYPTDMPGTVAGTENPRAYAARLAAPSDVATTIAWVNLYARNLTLDGQKVAAGAEVSAYTTTGTKVGSFRMAQDGKFGFMPVYSDAGLSEQITGLKAGEQFKLRVNGVEANETFTWTRSGDRLEVGRLTAKTTGSVPTSYSLAQNYPNPFNPSTTISFSLPANGQARLEVYNVLGELVAVPFNGMAEAGDHQVVWDGRDSNGGTVASGVYFYRLSADNYTETKKMMLLK